MEKAVLQWIVFVVGMFSSTAGVATDIGSVIRGNEPILNIGRFGRGDPVVISNGYLFVDFKYVPPPYIIQRIGQAVTVNKIIVNCLYTNAIPETFETKTSERLGSDGRMHTIISPPHPASWIKGTADAHVSSLSNMLGKVAIFLPGAHRPLKDDRQASQWIQRSMPVSAKINLEEFPRALMVALSTQEEGDVWKSAKKVSIFWHLSEIDTLRLVKEAKVTPALIERLRDEIAEANAPKPIKIPPYAKLASELAVVSTSAHEFKLDVVFENGLAPSLNDDWEIEDIQFETNATRVVASRAGHPPLPKTRSIRSISRRTATIESLLTGESCTSAITDKPERVVLLDGIKYQVVDIRPSTQTVLLKNCSTGEKLLVAPKTEPPKKESK